MDHGERPPRGWLALVPPSGLGTRCWEAQPDGVPCSDLGADCRDCDRARVERARRPPPPDALPGRPANAYA